jgi:hypothetical protein
LQRREWIVVTSDRDIADHAWSMGSMPVSSEDFLNALRLMDLSDTEKEYHEEQYDEEEYNEPRRKGSPRQLSKKEKAIKRAISKL